ncbi:MAG: site-2 protease family protein, partial [Candidatus Nanohaloarchaea archaeon]|nr:site-2 protease family protein [Candidatus Nanohaloarchaea archaeon]
GLRDFARATDNFSVNESVTIAGRFNGSSFNITARLGTYPSRNLSYRPAPIDPLLVWIEERYPGTIERFERYNDIVVEESVQTRIARWRWIRSEYDTLDARAHQRINTLKGRLPERKGGFLGISIASQPVTEVKEGMGMAAVFATIFMKFLFFMVLIHSGIGAANLLPAKPFDGGWMLSIIVHRVRSEWEHGISTFFTVTTIALILFNIGVPLLGSVV